MAESAAKLWIQDNLNTLATTRALEAIQEGNGWSLPCVVTAVTGSIVTVTFEVAGPWTLPPLTLPRAESQWVRTPTQVGDFGITVPVDTFIGGVSGLGAGVANMTVDYGNLSRLVFLPIGAVGFGAIPDPNKAWVNGPAGTVVSDTAQQATHVVAAPVGTAGTITSTVHNPAGAGATTIRHTLDGVNNQIVHALTSAAGAIKTIVDGSGNAISHVVPTGGLIGLGALAGSIPSTGALMRNADLSTFQSSLLSARLNDQIALVNLMHSAGTISSGQLTTILASLVAGFLPAIGVPAGSAAVRSI